MAPWKGHRRNSWASNGNISVYLFAVLFVCWLAFQIWARLPSGPPPPTGLDPMVMAALGVAVTSKSVEKRQQEVQLKQEQTVIKQDVEKLKEVAVDAHPEAAKKLEEPHERDI